MTWLILLVMPTVMFVALDLLCRGSFRLPRGLGRLRAIPLPRAVRRSLTLRLRARRGERLVRVDVFDTFHLQARLGAVADEIRRLEADRLVYAKAHRLRAARGAYDDLLAEACRCADVRAPGGLGRDGADVDGARMSAELELASRGWSW